jgi:hypothetical protein
MEFQSPLWGWASQRATQCRQTSHHDGAFSVRTKPEPSGRGGQMHDCLYDSGLSQDVAELRDGKLRYRDAFLFRGAMRKQLLLHQPDGFQQRGELCVHRQPNACRYNGLQMPEPFTSAMVH